LNPAKEERICVGPVLRIALPVEFSRMAVMSSPAPPPRLLYCRCAFAQVVPQETKDAVLQHLSAGEAAFDSVADLCEMSARRDPRLSAIAAAGPLKIAACHRRAVMWLFHAAGSALAEESTEIVNMRTLSPTDACARMDAPDLDSTAP
jgi:hypothetical protein